jgi:hypothetical protein
LGRILKNEESPDAPQTALCGKIVKRDGKELKVNCELYKGHAFSCWAEGVGTGRRRKANIRPFA